MKIAIAATNKDKNSDISPMGARAPFYLIFNEKGDFLETLSNPFAIGGGGAGFAVAKMLADKKVNMVIASAFGPNMITALKERDLQHSEMNGNAKEAISKIASK
ncbi:MAG: NifB/NifX family molybdenum-iron cluster-binding protein [Patescibacteria group bacterium]|nr:NifB/NifX family molybdenum-iron cluster-binding protein [Patescibacteria group bacterium]